MNKREVVVLSGVRTAIGTYGGTLKDQPLVELGAAVVRGSRLAEEDSACGIAAVGAYGQLVDGLALNAPVASRRRPPTT